MQFLDQLSLANHGQLYFGGDTTAAAGDEFFYRGTLKPFSLTLLHADGQPIPGETGVNFGAMDAVSGMNAGGDCCFVTASQPGPVDYLIKNGVKFVRAGETLAGETVNSLHHPQIVGDGTPIYLADIGANTATDVALFRGTTLLFREGDMVDGVPVSSIGISEATAGLNLRANENGDYILVVDDGDAQGQDVHIILNGENVLESGDALDETWNWGASIGFVNDIVLNDCGELALVTDLVPAAGGRRAGSAGDGQQLRRRRHRRRFRHRRGRHECLSVGTCGDERVALRRAAGGRQRGRDAGRAGCAGVCRPAAGALAAIAPWLRQAGETGACRRCGTQTCPGGWIFATLPAASICWYSRQFIFGRPLSTCFMVMQPSTGQTREHMLQPTQVSVLIVKTPT